MARRKYKKLSPKFRANKGKRRALSITGSVTRQSTTAGEYSDPYAFEACVQIRGAGACREGRNPRAALANAMTAVAKGLRKRRGSFKGL